MALSINNVRMGRADRVSKAILAAVYREEKGNRRGILARILHFFSVFNITLTRYDAIKFEKLRDNIWQYDHATYRESFDTKMLKPAGDLGYSGSTFFMTLDTRFLIKSLPRKSEYQFFSEEMLDRYAKHMTENPSSLLVRITDFLHAPHTAIGSALGITPSHHIIMENIMYGKDSDTRGEQWETFDLKPVSYFYPERDLAGGHLASDAVKERILDTFEDKIRVTKEEMEGLLDELASDSKLLEQCNVVDYSLFLVRYPPNLNHERDLADLESQQSPWRKGITSSDKKWTYRAVILDFFWAKHKPHAKAMTFLIKSFNLVGGKGHMSITTDAADYRKRFLEMTQALFEVESSPFGDDHEEVMGN